MLTKWRNIKNGKNNMKKVEERRKTDEQRGRQKEEKNNNTMPQKGENYTHQDTAELKEKERSKKSYGTPLSLPIYQSHLHPLSPLFMYLR